MSQDDDLQKPSKTIPQFCEIENLSASSYYKLKRAGLAPDELHVPGTEIVRITATAYREWRERMATLARTKEAEIERARRAEQRRAAGKSAAVSSRHVSRRRAGRT